MKHPIANRHRRGAGPGHAARAHRRRRHGRSQSQVSRAEPIVIAMPLALTGVISFYDQPNLAGAQIAVAQINKKGGVLGRPLKIISADTKSDLGLIAGVANSLLDKGADVMIPTLDYDFGGPSARAANAKKIPAISEAGDSRFGLQGIGRVPVQPVPVRQRGRDRRDLGLEQGLAESVRPRDPSISYSKTFTENFKYSWGKLAARSPARTRS